VPAAGIEQLSVGRQATPSNDAPTDTPNPRLTVSGNRATCG